MTPDAHSELLNLEQTVAAAQAAAYAGAAVLSVELLPSAPAVKPNGALVEGSMRVPASEPQSLELVGIGHMFNNQPVVGAPATYRLTAGESDRGASLADVDCATRPGANDKKQKK